MISSLRKHKAKGNGQSLADELFGPTRGLRDFPSPTADARRAKYWTTDADVEEKKAIDRQAVEKQRQKDFLMRQALREESRTRVNKAIAELQADKIKQDEGEITPEKTVDERVAHCKHLQYDKGVDLFSIQYTSIHKAAMEGDYLGVRYFLERKLTGKMARVGVDDYDLVGICPIHYAAGFGHVQIIELLATCGCDVNIGTIDGLTPMMFAAKGNHLQAMKTLFYLGSNVIAKARNHSTACHFAAQTNHGEAILLLKSFLAEFKAAAVAAHVNHTAAQDLSILNSSEGKLVTEMKGMSAMFAILVDKLTEILKDGKIKAHEILNVDEGSIIDSPTLNGIRPLHVAAENDCMKALEALLSCSIDINARDVSAETALHKAARAKHAMIYRRLVDAGVNETLQNNIRQTARQLMIDDIDY